MPGFQESRVRGNGIVANGDSKLKYHHRGSVEKWFRHDEFATFSFIISCAMFLPKSETARPTGSELPRFIATTRQHGWDASASVR
jgi:hypothetical protein